MANSASAKVRAMIVEDNVESLNELKSLLKDFNCLELVGEASNGRTAIDVIDRRKPDLLFLDIQLPGIDGFEVLQRIRHRPMVIFVTAYDQYAVRAFEVNGVDYLLKPITPERLHSAIDRAMSLDKKPDSDIMEVVKYIIRHKYQEMPFSVREGDQILIIPQEDIYYFKAEDKYIFLYTKNKRYFYQSTLKELLNTLDPDTFCRVNRSCIAALSKIRKLKKGILGEYKIILADTPATAINISKNHLAELKEKLNIHLKL